MKFSSLRAKHKKMESNAYNDETYREVIKIRDKFIQYNLDTWDTFSWKLINDYLVFRTYEAVTKGQLMKIAELIVKYNDESLMWEHLIETQTQRQKEMDRLMNLVREVLKYSNDPLVRKNKRDLTLFLKGAVNIRRGLIVNVLTDKQKKFINKIERFVGIYYDDLSPEENGFIIEGVEDDTVN